MPKKGIKAHAELKQWLLDLGKNKGYESFSGDSEPIDIRIKMKRIEYKPDVIWKWKSGFYVIELAFSEDWRAIVGEFLLASMIKNCDWFYIITVGDTEFTHDLFKLLEKKLDFHNWISYTFEESDLKDIKKMKRDIKSHLKEQKWIS